MEFPLPLEHLGAWSIVISRALPKNQDTDKVEVLSLIDVDQHRRSFGMLNGTWSGFSLVWPRAVESYAAH